MAACWPDDILIVTELDHLARSLPNAPYSTAFVAGGSGFANSLRELNSSPDTDQPARLVPTDALGTTGATDDECAAGIGCATASTST